MNVDTKSAESRLSSAASSSLTASGSATKAPGTSLRITASTTRRIDARAPSSRSEAITAGSTREKTSRTSTSFVVIRSDMMPAICPAFAGMMPCQPNSPSGWPAGAHTYTGHISSGQKVMYSAITFVT